VFLFKRILNFKKAESAELDKRGTKRYPVGAKSPIKAKLTLPARDDEGHLVGGKSSPMDWGGRLTDLSSSGANIRLHPAALAAAGDATCLKLELDHMLFEVEGQVAHFRTGQQHTSCGIILNFPDSHTRKAFLQLMEPVVIGSSLEPAVTKTTPGSAEQTKEQYTGESSTVLNVWRDHPDGKPKVFELSVHDFLLQGTTESPGLKIGYRDGAKAGKGHSRPALPMPLTAGQKEEVRRLFQFIVQNLGKGVPSDVRKFLELFAV
jgi:hypothetical protein